MATNRKGIRLVSTTKLASGRCSSYRNISFFESFERTAEPLAKVKVILEAHDKAATRFFNELFVGPSAISDAGISAHHLIENNLKARQLRSDAGLDALLNLLRAFHIACNTSIKQLNNASLSSAFLKGNAWRTWTGQLAEILEAAKLPVSVGKDGGSKNNHKQSPFALFVWELQKCLAAEFRRHTQSEAALADALSEAHSQARKLGNKPSTDE